MHLTPHPASLLLGHLLLKEKALFAVQVKIRIGIAVLGGGETGVVLEKLEEVFVLRETVLGGEGLQREILMKQIALDGLQAAFV